MHPLLIVDNLCFKYQGIPVLRNVTFSVNSGDFVGIIGPNGGGKTTLLKAILGFIKPLSGKITINGLPPVQARKNLAYVPQFARYDREFPISVLEVVLSGRLFDLPWYGKYSKEDYEAAWEALTRVGLKDFASRRFGTLSGGQAQRVLIARALASKPNLLLLDEPTASVDAQSEADIHALLNQLKGTMTILMVTHDVDAIINDVQRVICVRGESVVLNPREVCEHFALGLYHKPLLRLDK